jgi:hypothetical protein
MTKGAGTEGFRLVLGGSGGHDDYRSGDEEHPENESIHDYHHCFPLDDLPGTGETAILSELTPGVRGNDGVTVKRGVNKATPPRPGTPNGAPV